MNNLKTVVLSEGVENIPSIAFAGTKNVINLIIPDSVTEIGEDAFEFCDFRGRYGQVYYGI